MLEVLGSASTALIKSGYTSTGEDGATRTSRWPGSERRTASAWPQFPHRSPLHPHLCSQLRSDKKGGKYESRSQDPGDVSPEAAFTGHLVHLVPQGPNSHLAHIPALSHPVAGDGETAVAQRDWPCHHPPGCMFLYQKQTCPATAEPQESRIQTGGTPGSSWSSLEGRQSLEGHWLMQENSSNIESNTTDLGSDPPPNPSST